MKTVDGSDDNFMTDPGWVRWADVWRAERAAIGEPGVDEEGPRHAALCLSGGGIRSAACCLGVLQALAQARLLGRFHYASTVSGGGYIGAWLQILIGRFGVAGMQRRLADPGMLEVKHLRSYTNWLMPAGWLSMQGWTTVAIYLRNVLLNWLMFGPLFLLFALVCVGARSLFFALEPADAAGAGPVLVGLLFLALGFSGLVWGMAQACTALPSRVLDAAGRPHYWDAAMIRWRILAPSMAWAFCAPLALAPAWPWLSHGWGAWALPGLFVAGSLAGYGVAATARDGAAPSFSQNVLPWCLGSLAGGLVVHAAIRIAAALPLKHLAEAVAVGGPPFLLLGYATVSAVHAGLRGATQERGRPALGGHMAALDVEWMARITAARLRVAVMWFVLSLSVLSGADAIMRDHPLTGMQPAWLGALLAGPAVAWLGKQAFSQFDALISGKTGLVTWDLLLRAGAVLFAAAVLIGSAMALQNWLAAVQGWLSPGACGFVWCQAPAMLASGGVLLLILTAADRWIQTNRFSMHGFYRERLVTAFAGSARPTRESGEAGRRRPDPLTGFDPDDNPALHSLSGAEPRRLFPVINATLNLTSVRRPDWADRKAAPFTFTPLHCGAASLRRGGAVCGDGRVFHDRDDAGVAGDGDDGVGGGGQSELGVSFVGSDGVRDDVVQCAAGGVVAEPGAVALACECDGGAGVAAVVGRVVCAGGGWGELRLSFGRGAFRQSRDLRDVAAAVPADRCGGCDVRPEGDAG